MHFMHTCSSCIILVTLQSVSSTPPLRERKKHETRQAINDAAFDLAKRHGPAAITVEDIAEAANVSARTVFNYFPTKEAAILGFDPARQREMVLRVEDRPKSEPPLAAIRAAYRGAFDAESVTRWRERAELVRNHPHLYSAYLATFASFDSELTAAIGRRTGTETTDGMYPGLVAAVATTAMRVAVMRAIDNSNVSVDDLIDTAFDHIADGLVPPPDG